MSALSGCVVLALAAGVVAPTAWGQGSLPRDLVAQVSPDAGRIKEALDPLRPALTGSNRVERAEARRDIEAWIDQPDATAGFRFAIANELGPDLETMLGGTDEHAAYNALLLAGTIATTDAVALVLDRLEDERPAVRYGAVEGLGRAIDALARGSRALGDADVNRILSGLSARMAGDGDPGVVQKSARVLASAGLLESPGDALGRAYSAIARGVSAQLASIDSVPAHRRAEMGRALLAAATEVRDVITRPATRLPEATLRDAGAMAAWIVYTVHTRFEAAERRTENIPEATHTLLSQMLAASEVVLGFSTNKFNAVTGLSDSFSARTDAGDRDFRTLAFSILSPGGLASQAPLNVSGTPPLLPGE